MKPYLDKAPGGIFFIPLFLPGGIKDNLKSYYRYKFQTDEQYAFGRLIDSTQSSGDLVEIFNYVGPVPQTPDEILGSGLMFDPLHVSMGFAKKRWRLVFENRDYDRGQDSNYANINFLLGDYENPILWTGGKEMGGISPSKSKAYNHWRIYPPTQLEQKIKDHLAGV